MFEDKDEDEDINEVETVEGEGSIPVARLKGVTVEENRKPSATSKIPVARSKGKTAEEDKKPAAKMKVKKVDGDFPGPTFEGHF